MGRTGIELPLCPDGSQTSLSRIKGRNIPAEFATQGVIGLQQIDVGAVRRDSAYPGDRMTVRVGERNNDEVWDGKDFSSGHTVSVKETLHRLLHTIDLRAALHETVAQLGGQAKKGVVIQCQGGSPAFREDGSGA